MNTKMRLALRKHLHEGAFTPLNIIVRKTLLVLGDLAVAVQKATPYCPSSRGSI